MKTPGLLLSFAILACPAGALGYETQAAKVPPAGAAAKPEPERKSFFESRSNTARAHAAGDRPVANSAKPSGVGADPGKAGENGRSTAR